MAEVERATMGAIRLPSHRYEGASESSEGRPAPADMEDVPQSPPLPLQRMRGAVPKRLCPRSR